MARDFERAIDEAHQAEVDELNEEIDALRADLAAKDEAIRAGIQALAAAEDAHNEARADLAAARARIVELCTCLEDARPYVLDAAKNTEEIARIDAALNKE